MPTISGVASTFTLPNYHGPLFVIRGNNNLFSGVMGGIADGGGRVITSHEFGINIETLPDPSQPAILEGADIVTPSELTAEHQMNVTQIFDEAFGMTYSKTASPDMIGVPGDMDDVEHVANTPGFNDDPFEHQAALKLQIIRRKLNYVAINGVYQRPTDPTSTARKTRGVLAACDAGNVVDISGASLLKSHFDLLLRQMWDNGSFDDGGNTIIWVNSFNKQALTQLYAIYPMDRTVGGANIQQLETDFGTFGIAMDRDIPQDTILVANMSVISPVFNLVRDPRAGGATKGVLFREPVSTAKNAYIDHIYGEIGIDHGPGIYHGKIINTAIA
jgi:hypothetical protein